MPAACLTSVQVETVTIDGLTITNGSPHSVTFPTNAGGGILNDHATLTISNSTLSGNSTQRRPRRRHFQLQRDADDQQ